MEKKTKTETNNSFIYGIKLDFLILIEKLKQRRYRILIFIEKLKQRRLEKELQKLDKIGKLHKKEL